MKALIIVSKFPPEYSGPGVRLPKLYDHLNQKFDFQSLEVLCNGIEMTDDSDYTFGDFTVHRRVSCFRKNPFFSKILPKRIYNAATHWHESYISMKFLKTLARPDYIHILGTSGATAAGIALANRHNIPVLMELVTAKAEPRQRFYGMKKVAPPSGSAIIAMTSAAAERCRQAGFENNIWLRPNPINEDVFKPAPEHKQELRRTLTPFDQDDIVISSVAKIIPQKNQIFLLDVLRHLPEKYKLVIAGPLIKSGPLMLRDQAYVSDIRKKINDYGLEKRVHFIADYVDSASYMKASDIYALPAYDEGFGTPMLEAIACAIPVIANKDEISFREWISDGINGYACAMTPDEWARAIEKAAAFPADQMLKASAEIRQKAGQKSIYRGYADLIEKLVKKEADAS